MMAIGFSQSTMVCGRLVTNQHWLLISLFMDAYSEQLVQTGVFQQLSTSSVPQ